MPVLTDDEVERIARRIVDLLRRDDAPRELLTATEIGARFGISAAWVREHADEFGAVRLGGGSKPRLRFDPALVRAALNEPSAGKRSLSSRSPGSTARTAPAPAPAGGTLVDIRAPTAFNPPRTREKMAPRRTNARGRDDGRVSARREADDTSRRSTLPALAPPEKEQP